MLYRALPLSQAMKMREMESKIVEYEEARKIFQSDCIDGKTIFLGQFYQCVNYCLGDFYDCCDQCTQDWNDCYFNCCDFSYAFNATSFLDFFCLINFSQINDVDFL